MFSQKKPYSAVTVKVESLTSGDYSVDDLSGIPDLVEVIKLQASGPSEAARAIRKKLKYGNVHRQLRALVILDGLIQNAGSRFQRTFADEPLLERLRVCGTSGLSDPAVRRKCTELFRDWSQYASTAGLERVARLHKELPKRKVAVTQEKSRVIRETENPFGDDEEEEAAERASRAPIAGPSFRPQPAPAAKTGKKKKKEKEKDKGQRGPFDLEAEKDKIKSMIAESSIESTNLKNSLQSINRERQRISENREAVQHFEACKQLRRRILRYVRASSSSIRCAHDELPSSPAASQVLCANVAAQIHLVESEQWLGSLLHANDELVHALMSFEQLDQSIDADSDSDDELAQQAHVYRMAALRTKDDQPARPLSSPHAPDLAGLSLQPKPRPGAPPIPSAPNSVLVPARPPRPPAANQSIAARRAYDNDQGDDGDPFSDDNVVMTPMHEADEPQW